MKKLIKPLAVFLLILAIFAVFFVYLPYTRIKAKGNVVVASAKVLKADMNKNDIDLMKNDLADTAKKYADFEKEAKSVYWMSFIPYVSDFKNGVEAGTYLVHAGQETLDAIYPYADLIGFKKGTASFVEKSADDRLATAINTLDKVLGKLDTISNDINEAEKRINTINPDRYPEKLGKTVVRAKLINIKEQFQGISSLFVDAKPLVKNIPQIFGSNQEKQYLLLFQNDKEQRATGGFLTSYAVFKINKGKIKIEHSEDIYSLDASIANHPTAPDKILKYHKGVSQFYIRDSNLSPDFPASLDLFNSLYNKSGEKVKYDGVFALDSKILVDMLTIFGDTEVDGVTFSAKTDKRCDCPQVLYELFDMVDRPVGYVKTNRKGILGDLMYELFYKALRFSPSKYWGTLFQTMMTNLNEKHILLNFNDPTIQASVEKLNFGGRIRQYDGDYLHVNNVNFAGAKSNLFVTKTLDSKTTFENGKVQREVHVEFRNPYPASDCNLERGNLCLNAILRDWIRVYVPKGSTLDSFQGSLTKVLTYDDLGKTVYEGFLTVPTQGKADVIVKYTLPDSIKQDNYKLLIQKQPGESTEQLKITVDSKKKFDGLFDTDKEIKK